jgi:hypothetical protein
MSNLDELIKAFSAPVAAVAALLVIALSFIFTLWVRERHVYVKDMKALTKDFADKLEAKNKDQLVLATSILKELETNSIMLRQTRELHDRVEVFLDHLEPLINKLTGRSPRPKPTSTASALTPVPPSEETK